MASRINYSTPTFNCAQDPSCLPMPKHSQSTPDEESMGRKSKGDTSLHISCLEASLVCCVKLLPWTFPNSEFPGETSVWCVSSCELVLLSSPVPTWSKVWLLLSGPTSPAPQKAAPESWPRRWLPWCCHISASGKQKDGVTPGHISHGLGGEQTKPT